MCLQYGKNSTDPVVICIYKLLIKWIFDVANSLKFTKALEQRLVDIHWCSEEFNYFWSCMNVVTYLDTSRLILSVQFLQSLTRDFLCVPLTFWLICCNLKWELKVHVTSEMCISSNELFHYFHYNNLSQRQVDMFLSWEVRCFRKIS